MTQALSALAVVALLAGCAAIPFSGSGREADLGLLVSVDTTQAATGADAILRTGVVHRGGPAVELRYGWFPVAVTARLSPDPTPPPGALAFDAYWSEQLTLRPTSTPLMEALVTDFSVGDTLTFEPARFRLPDAPGRYAFDVCPMFQPRAECVDTFYVEVRSRHAR